MTPKILKIVILGVNLGFFIFCDMITIKAVKEFPALELGMMNIPG
jgi:hypothetical protein